MKRIILTETQYRGLLNEINYVAQKSNITVTSLPDFKNVVSSLGINDQNVEQYAGKYCFIEIGSGFPRISAEIPHTTHTETPEEFYEKTQWYFTNEHVNVIKLEFDDNQKFNNKFPKKDGFDGNTAATAVKLSSHENKYGKNGFTFYYEGGLDFTNDMALRLKKFVDYNLSLNENVKFIIHCMQGKSRSAAVGTYIAKKIGQFTDDFLSEYDIDGASQFNIGMSTKGQPKYPHKNVMTRMGEVEGWNSAKDDTKEQWFYNTLINHPGTGYLSKKQGQLTEDVFINNVKGKDANLVYNKRNSSAKTRNIGNMKSADMLNTGKMDQDNADTFIVPLKGGINSYNITSIRGVDVMHYFKNRIKSNQKNVGVKTDVIVNGVKKEYDLIMEDPEWNEFKETFINKVGRVIDYAVSNFGGKDKFNGISIYPVASSSGFNKMMCYAIAGKVKVSGLPTMEVEKDMFRKDLSDLQKDTDFINKNKEYYSQRKYIGGTNDMTHEEGVDYELRRFAATTNAQSQELIDEYNRWVDRVVSSYRNKTSAKTLVNNYEQLVNAKKAIRQKLGKHEWDKAFKKIKGAKGPSIDARSEGIWNIVAAVKGKTWLNNNKIDIANIDKNPFQIKNMTNDARMGLKNYFKVQDEYKDKIDEIKNTIFVIFDDNVSGGATLSDICYQCKKLGINYIVPITFGEMNVKYGNGPMRVSMPSKSGRFENY